MRRHSTTLFWLASLAFGATVTLGLQGRGQAPQTGRANAPIDLTGTWISVVSEDWRHRMMTPRKGDYESVPISGEGRKVADGWDIAKDDGANQQCKAFGVGGIVRQPGRVRVSWQDDNTLKMEFDAGTQTRLISFDRNRQPGAEKTWQGYSIGEWTAPAGRGGAAVRAQLGNSTGPVAPGGGGRGQRGGPALAESLSQGGALKIVTRNFREGYLRKNGVPYSENASITEYVHRLPTVQGLNETWLMIVTVVEDPRYLTQPFYTSTQFKLEPDGSRWAANPCRTPPPPPPVP